MSHFLEFIGKYVSEITLFVDTVKLSNTLIMKERLYVKVFNRLSWHQEMEPTSAIGTVRYRTSARTGAHCRGAALTSQHKWSQSRKH